ncbi:MAG: amidase [Candidatus Binataceae bacterium]
MAVKPPTLDDLSRIAAKFNMGLPDSELRAYKAVIDPLLATYDRLDEMPEPSLEVKYPNRPNWRPAGQENPLGAWYWRTDIKGATHGPLAGKTLAIKDNVCVAGVPLMCGTRLLEGYVPTIDATIVTRILDAGGTILGKAVCESLCFSGNSNTAECGIVRNPYDLSRTPGGSSTGSGALVADGSVDMAIGADQAGSIRIPSAFSGIYGMKPTYGLVPYTGIGPMELTIDHTGPMARSVADLALLLEVIAGPDGLDPRQRTGIVAEKYTAALNGDVKGMRVGVVKEGFGRTDNPASEKDVDEAVRESAHALSRLGCEVREISIPIHRDGVHIWSAIACEGIPEFVFEQGGAGRHWKGYYPTGMIEAFTQAIREHGDYLSITAKTFRMLGGYMNEQYRGRYYAKAQNLSRPLAAAYDDALKQCDILVMPTATIKAAKIPLASDPLEAQIVTAIGAISNTCPFNVTGHPALNVPCALSAGLPVGMMFVGRMGEDATILKVAGAFQDNIFAAPLPPSHKSL